ncbi:hypothetical protein TspCOW1_18780 [Thiohalobacter sp. COW1]|uniref:DUF3613 domain-containing protein n=1 Tax=Thiohalobacter sp. COW1 TaxID=2795687 RepID=UPI0019167C3C|nr:DUF3613 domain-containing protein [Thiohalobacter sp. COW1]BCO31775.1 hypothetical protein TspCOW1_18780 [Thiohalobacter sp. COW1]
MMKRWIECPISTLGLLAVLLVAQTAVAAPLRDGEPTGEAGVRAWLELQASGRQAATTPGQPGEAAARVWTRYLESFEYPIPETYFEQQDGFVSE